MLVEDQRGLMRLLANALLEADEGIVCCERCGGITESMLIHVVSAQENVPKGMFCV